jgi:hypothetical protein
MLTPLETPELPLIVLIRCRVPASAVQPVFSGRLTLTPVNPTKKHFSTLRPTLREGVFAVKELFERLYISFPIKLNDLARIVKACFY